MSIATSTAIGLGVAAAGTLGGAAIASHGANKAADTQASAANNAAQLQATASQNALDFQKQQYNDSVARQQPWLQAGTKALGQLQNLPAFQAPTDVTEQNDPGYQFRLAQGQKALQNQASARGGLAGGAALKAAQQYGQDYASNEYGNVYNRAMGQYQQQYNQLAGLAGEGQTTATGLSNLGAYTGNQVGNTLQTGAAAQATDAQNAAAARASGYVQSGNTYGQAFSGLGKAAGNAYMLDNTAPTGGWFNKWNPNTGNPMGLQLPQNNLANYSTPSLNSPDIITDPGAY